MSGETYKGEWLNDLKNGYGTYKFKNGNKYKGIWKNNKKDGQNGMKNGKKYGQSCIFTYKNGDIYEGEWIDND